MKNKKHILLYCLIIILFLPYATFGFRLLSDNNFPDSNQSLFDSEEILYFDLIADYDSILADRGENPSYHDGRIKYSDESQKQISVNCRIKTRGNFRKDPANCKFPPLLLNIKKKSAKKTFFDGMNRLKVVTHCQNERYVFEEYYLYKMYNLITDLSYKVRLVYINYIHEENGIQKILFTKQAFLIEEDESLAKRYNADVIDIFKHQVQLNRDNILKQTMFQYMIGNKDWFVTTRHNVKLLIMGQEKEVYAVPYDFDFSAIIMASYTLPKNIPIEMIDERRIYKGLCQSGEETILLREFFNNLKPSFINLYTNSEYLKKSSSKKSVRYIEEFYKLLNDDDLSRLTFQEKPNCMEPPPGLFK